MNLTVYKDGVVETSAVDKPVAREKGISFKHWFEATPVEDESCYLVSVVWFQGKIVARTELGFTQEMSISSLQEFLHKKSGIHFEYGGE